MSRVSAILLAAGESTRMGRPKALLDWHGHALLSYQVRELLATPVERLVVVLGHRRDELAPLVEPDRRIRLATNLDYTSGKVSSIVTGVAATPVGHDVLVLGVDQPRPARLTRRVVDEHRRTGGPITVAAHAGRRGHPVVFAAALRDELLAITEATYGLRAVLQAHESDVHAVETGDPVALVNLNTPDDYAAALLLSTTSSARAGNQ